MQRVARSAQCAARSKSGIGDGGRGKAAAAVTAAAAAAKQRWQQQHQHTQSASQRSGHIQLASQRSRGRNAQTRNASECKRCKAYACGAQQRSGSNDKGGGNSIGGIGSASGSSSASRGASSPQLRASEQKGGGEGADLYRQDRSRLGFSCFPRSKGADKDVDGQVRGPGEVDGHEHDGHERGID